MTKKPTKRIAEKGKTMEMRVLKAPYGVHLPSYAFQRATMPIFVVPTTAPTQGHKTLESSYEELARAMQDLKTRVARVEDTLARLKSSI